MIRIERSGEREVVEISFGNATLRAQPVSEERRALGVEEGQRAMRAFAEAILAPPGVTLPRKAGVPIFYVDVENPTLIIRELDGAGSVEKSKMGGSSRCSGVGVSGVPRSEEPPDALVATSPLDVFRATPIQRIQLLKGGLSARDAVSILADLGIPENQAFKAINVSRAAVKRKVRRGEALAVPEAERVLGVAKLVGQVQQMVEESGNSEGFSAFRWISGWLVEPLPALGGERPIELLDTMEGQEVVAGLLRQIHSGAYA